MFANFLIVSVSILLAFFLLRWIKNVIQFVRIVNKLPGPKIKPIIGNLDHFLCDPVQLWINTRRLTKQYGPIFRSWAAHKASVFLSGPEDIELVLSSMKHIEKSSLYALLMPWLGTGLLTSGGQKWHFRRKLLTPAFHFNILQQFRTVFVEQTEQIVEIFKTECNKPYINIVPHITQFTLNSICETAMGTRLDPTNTTQNLYRDSIYKMGEAVVYRLVRPWIYTNFIYFLTSSWRECKKPLKILHDFSKSVIENRKINFEPFNEADIDDVSLKRRLAMLDLLISAESKGAAIDDEGIREEVDTFMFEGHDTTAMSICFTLMVLACRKDIQEEVVKELDQIFYKSDRQPSYQDLQDLTYLERVIKESLRMYPSVPFISRVSGEDIQTHEGYTIPSGCIVHMLIYDLHHNPELYPEPEKFDPDRFLPENTQNRHPFAYIPFSAGPRNCIGQKFAMMELKIVISAILRNFILEPVDRLEDIVITSDLVLRHDGPMKLKLRPRIE